MPIEPNVAILVENEDSTAMPRRPVRGEADAAQVSGETLRLPRMCRWFGHSAHWPWTPRGRVMPLAGWCFTGGLKTYCERCGTTIETGHDMVSEFRG
jgi:hypothetical protein